MAGDGRGSAGSLLGLLGAVLLACNNVDIAGTLRDEAGAGQGGVPAAERDAGAAGAASGSTSNGGTDPSSDAGTPLPSPGLTCAEGSQSLLFLQADPLAAFEPSEAIPDALQLLYVNENCTFWVLDSSLSGQMRTGTLELYQARALWADLGTEARVGLPRDEGTSGVGPVWIIEDGVDQLACLGQCVSDSVDPAIRDLFETAVQWVQDLYARGEPFEGDVDDIGLPVESRGAPGG